MARNQVTVGNATSLRASSRTNSMPSIPGMRTSAKIHPTGSVVIALRKPFADSVQFGGEAIDRQHFAKSAPNRYFVVDYKYSIYGQQSHTPIPQELRRNSKHC